MYSEKTLIVDIVTNGSGDDVWYSLSAPGKDIISALRTGDVLLRKITRTERNNAATPAVPQSDEYDYFKLVAVRDVEDGSQVAMLFDNGDIYVNDPNDDEYPCLDGIEPSNISLVPPASAEDAGKVLTVNDNGSTVWARGRFVVTFTQDPDTETWSAGKTIAECVAAWEAGQTLFAYNVDDGIYIPMTFYNDGDAYMEFVCVDGETGTAFGFGIDAEGVSHYGG